MSELDDLEEFDLKPERSAPSSKRVSAGRAYFLKGNERAVLRPKWKHQLAHTKSRLAK